MAFGLCLMPSGKSATFALSRGRPQQFGETSGSVGLVKMMISPPGSGLVRDARRNAERVADYLTPEQHGQLEICAPLAYCSVLGRLNFAWLAATTDSVRATVLHRASS